MNSGSISERRFRLSSIPGPANASFESVPYFSAREAGRPVRETQELNKRKYTHFILRRINQSSLSRSSSTPFHSAFLDNSNTDKMTSMIRPFTNDHSNFSHSDTDGQLELIGGGNGNSVITTVEKTHTGSSHLVQKQTVRQQRIQILQKIDPVTGEVLEEKREVITDGDEPSIEMPPGQMGIYTSKDQPFSLALPGSTSGSGELMSMEPIDMRINNVLGKVLENFNKMKDEKREEFVAMFPALKKVRTNEPYEEVVETIRNPDGSTTTIKKKAMKSSYEKRTVAINGVVQVSQQRAFLEYQGPEGGFKMKLSEGNDPNVESENEDDDDDMHLLRPARRALDNISEIQDAQSAIVIRDKDRKVPQLQATGKKTDKLEKAWYAAKELVDSEERYVDKLKLLEDFRKRIEDENKKSSFLKEKDVDKIFSNLQSLFDFHSNFFLPKLLERRRDWHQTQQMCDQSLVKLTSYLKLYSEYTNNYSKATKAFEDCLKKHKRFGNIVKETEQLPECENLPLVSHLICPVQRVMRYHLLLQEYRKNLPPEHPDQAGAKSLLDSVLAAAEHANEIMKKLDRYKPVLAVQESLGNQISDLVTPTRELLKQGKLSKISARTGEHQTRYVFLFNDMLLVCSERRVTALSKYKLRAIFPIDGMQVCEGDRLDTEHTFYIRVSEQSNSSGEHCIELYAENQKEKDDWISILWSAINNYNSCKDSFKRQSGGADSSGDEKLPEESSRGVCSICGSGFSFFKRDTTCLQCGALCCKSCCNHRMRSNNGRPTKVCDKCHAEYKEKRVSVVSMENKKQSLPKPNYKLPNLLQVKANEPSIYHGYVQLKTSTHKTLWTKRYFVLRENFVLYSYKTEDDKHAMTALPLPGCTVDITPGETNEFKLSHMNRNYHIKCDSEEDIARWMAVIELASQAEFPTNAAN